MPMRSAVSFRMAFQTMVCLVGSELSTRALKLRTLSPSKDGLSAVAREFAGKVNTLNFSVNYFLF